MFLCVALKEKYYELFLKSGRVNAVIGYRILVSAGHVHLWYIISVQGIRPSHGQRQAGQSDTLALQL